MRLIEAVERLNMSGEIGDGMVATLHDLAAGARLEQGRCNHPLSRYDWNGRCEACGEDIGSSQECDPRE